ncbi:MAG: hypothetical protein Q7S56_03900 [Nanoarchaeota archaeon]|nr:hypothetical protein [Nanoarchaeota archaeon]
MESESLLDGKNKKKEGGKAKSEIKIDLGLDFLKEKIDFHKKLFKKRGFLIK